MKSSFLDVSYTLITIILGAIITFAPLVVKAETLDKYRPSAEMTTKLNSNKNMVTLDYMYPYSYHKHHLPILDCKIKLDNLKSQAINLGLVYRYNYSNIAILGTYLYFDHQCTSSNLHISNVTSGIELLSQYVDLHANIYLPQNKRREVYHSRHNTMRIDRTSIFALSSESKKYESSIQRGYDIEIGIPLLAFSNSLNNLFKTKFYVGKYHLITNNLTSIVGTRVRIEQQLGTVWSYNNSYKFHIGTETNFNTVQNRQSSIGIGIKITFNDTKNIYENPIFELNHRMMETVVRDIDIVTNSTLKKELRHDLYNVKDNTKINKIYYVGSAIHTYSGDGTKNNPLSFEQIKSIYCDNAMIVLTRINPSHGGTNISRYDYEQIQHTPYILNNYHDIQLSTKDLDPFMVTTTNKENGISILVKEIHSRDIIFRHNQVPLDQLNYHSKLITIPLLEQMIVNNIKLQISAAKVENDIAESDIEDNTSVSQTERTCNSGVKRHDLTPEGKEMYDLINNCLVNLQTSDITNDYVMRQIRYDLISDIIQNNPGKNLDDIQLIIQNNPIILNKQIHTDLAKKIMKFDSNNIGDDVDDIGGQQGIGIGHTGPKDVTSTASLDKLREVYGILDGDKALQLAKKIVIRVIQDFIPHITGDIEAIALSHRETATTTTYQQAAKQFLDNIKPQYMESNAQKLHREYLKLHAFNIIQEEIKSSLTSVNTNMAAYRALYRAETAVNQIFTEEILGRYNDKEMLAYAIVAHLDVKEIKNKLKIAGKKLTPLNIWHRQQENLQELIGQLGVSQRAYNMDHHYGLIDIGGIKNLYPAEGLIGHQSERMLSDSISCAHGYGIRILDSMQHHHSLVNLSDISPANFSDEFQNTVRHRVKKLHPQQQQQIEQWAIDIEDGGEINTIFHDNKSITFTVISHSNQNPLPKHYSDILTTVAAEMDSRYNFSHPNKKLQLVKKNDAVNVFKYIHYINFNI